MTFCLTDINSCFASCEKVFDPTIRRQGIVVASNNDGAIIAMDRVAKAKLGKHKVKFQPLFQWHSLLQQKGIAVRSANYELYGSFSNHFYDLLRQRSPRIYPYSVDEVFLDYRGQLHCEEAAEKEGRDIRADIWETIRLPVCTGFGPSITLSKAANQYAKDTPSLRGVCVIHEGNRSDILSKIDVGDIWGIGRKLKAHLTVMGITTAKQLASQSPATFRRYFNINMENTIRELNGESVLSWDEIVPPKKQIFSTRSFANPVVQYEPLRQALIKYVEVVSRKAREQGSLVKELVIFAHSSLFKGPVIRFQETCRMLSPTNEPHVLAGIVTDTMKAKFKGQGAYTKAGVGATILVTDKFYQKDLFAGPEAKDGLGQLTDAINSRFGKHTLHLASAGTQCG